MLEMSARATTWKPLRYSNSLEVAYEVRWSHLKLNGVVVALQLQVVESPTCGQKSTSTRFTIKEVGVLKGHLLGVDDV
jgi:hypothetical protein